VRNRGGFATLTFAALAACWLLAMVSGLGSDALMEDSPRWSRLVFGGLGVTTGGHLAHFRREHSERWAASRLYRARDPDLGIYTPRFFALLGIGFICGVVVCLS
jgi:hypothetical protein